VGKECFYAKVTGDFSSLMLMHQFLGMKFAKTFEDFSLISNPSNQFIRNYNRLPITESRFYSENQKYQS
jgi:hypothetical protein